MKHFLCKYIPPRADFLATMSEEEKELISQHGAFLDKLIGEGSVVAHGPVLDPSGGYGVSIFQVGDEDDIAAITAQDPIIKAGVGRYEHHPMLQLKAR